MLFPFSTVRLRLAVLNMTVFAVLLGVGSLTMFTTGQRYFEQHFDDRLADRAEAMANRIRVREDHPTGVQPGPRDRLNPFRFPGYFFQVRRPDGRLLERSKNLGKIELPFEAPLGALREDGDRALSTLQGETAQRLLGAPGELRLLNLMRRSEQDGHFVLQVAVSRRLVIEQIRDLRALLVTMISVGLVLAGLASWLLARQALAPIGEIAEVAEQLGGRDLTRRFAIPRGRDEITSMVATINRMLDRLQAAFDSQASFISSVSHELKTPLAVLLGSAQVVLQKKRTEAEYTRFVEQTEQEVRALSSTVEGLLVLAFAEADAPMPHAEILAVNEIIMDAVHRCQAQARAHDVRLVPQLPDPQETSQEAWVRADDELIQVAVCNLIRNAIRYSRPGGTVGIVVGVQQDQAVIEVQDQGPGIPETDLETIFKKFHRGPVPPGGKPGAGLGLTIARSVVELHEGALTAKNAPSGGACFVLTLPRVHPEA